VEKHGRAGRKIKPVASMHSWSACAATDEVCVPMARLNRVLSHDAANKTITAEAGIQLKDLYVAMDERDLAIASIPNVDTIQLGGATPTPPTAPTSPAARCRRSSPSCRSSSSARASS
jgi:FAD/FMN-containing dehydrogenase